MTRLNKNRKTDSKMKKKNDRHKQELELEAFGRRQLSPIKKEDVGEKTT